ncbi:MAG: alpha/beta hydrolase [Gammaproteobacteria bacterium]|nr:MAG: alpha/beta hydrolase [Gammaproteobacteria bacterium]
MTIRPIELRASGLVFECDAAGELDAPLVLLLHGFPQTSYTWRHQLPALAEAGFLAVAPNQRGYSPGARPEGVAHYATELLVADAIGIADTLGRPRFHLVGHDWGGQLAWLLAANHPHRVETLTVLSRPHPRAFAEAMKSDAQQAHRSRHHRAFQDLDSARLLLEDDARRLRRSFQDQGVADADIEAYLSRLASEEALDAALNWYRSAGTSTLALVGANVGNIEVPTLYLWGDEDATVGRAAAEATADCVDADYRMHVVEGAGHFLTDQQAEVVTRELLTALGS